MTILTIETAALAAAFLIPGTGDENTEPHRVARSRDGTGKVDGLRGRSPQGNGHPDCS